MCGECDRNENKAKNRPHIAIMLCNIQLIVFKGKKNTTGERWVTRRRTAKAEMGKDHSLQGPNIIDSMISLPSKH